MRGSGSGIWSVAVKRIEIETSQLTPLWRRYHSVPKDFYAHFRSPSIWSCTLCCLVCAVSPLRGSISAVSTTKSHKNAENSRFSRPSPARMVSILLLTAQNFTPLTPLSTRHSGNACHSYVLVAMTRSLVRFGVWAVEWLVFLVGSRDNPLFEDW